MSLLQEKDKNTLIEEFKKLTDEVTLVYFTQEMECQYCAQTHEILEEVSGLSNKIHLDVLDFVDDKNEAEKYGIDKIPGTVVTNGKRVVTGINFFGIPSGYEFASLIGAIIDMGTQKPELDDDIIAAIKAIDKPVHMQVFVTPTCPYCPGAVRMGHMMAQLNPNIRADMVEATEFPHLSNKYNVRGVPRTVINEGNFLEGAAPPQMVLDEVKKALQSA